MSFKDLLTEDRRLVILRALAEDHGYRLNESVLKKVLAHIGHDVGRDIVRADMTWLEQHGLLQIERLTAGASPGELWVAKLTEPGAEVARGRPHPGVARPSPR